MIEPLNNFGEDEHSDVKRGLDRDSLFMKAMLRLASINEESEVRIRNLSAGGLMAELPVRVARGERVEVNLRHLGWISGSVAWVAEGKIGVAFDHVIDPKIVRKPIAATEYAIPDYLQRFGESTQPKKGLRPV